jgi:ABC-2 type transport system ATP-binding protein
MRRVLTTLAVAAALVAAPAALPVTFDTGQHPRCRPGETFTCRDLFIESFDGTDLDATVYLPQATPAPAVLMTHGYSGWHRGGGDFNAQRFLAENGYVVLAYTSRGFGRSQGTVELDSPDFEVKDAQALIGWLADSANTAGAVVLDGPNDPRVGMAGGSYAGGIQLLTAAYDARVDAIAPEITWNDLRYSLAPNGVIKHGWIDLLYASGKYGGYLGPPGTMPPPVAGTDGVSPDQDRQVALTYLANDNVELPAGQTYSDGSRSTYEYLEKRSPVGGGIIDRIHADTLLIQGQKDTLFNVNEAVANFRAISDNRPKASTKLVIFSGGHGYGEITGERDQIRSRILTWFARHLRGEKVRTGAPVEVWQPWEAGTNFVGLRALPSRLTAFGVTPTSVQLANTPAPTSHSEVSNFQSETSSSSRDAAPGLTSADLALEVPPGTAFAGSPVLRFTISSSAPEAIVFAKLHDLDSASGQRTHLFRLVTPVRVRSGKGDFCSDSIPGPSSTSAVSAAEVCLPLSGLTWRVQEGHRLGLTLATSDSMYFGSRISAEYEITNLSLELPVLTDNLAFRNGGRGRGR